MGKYVSFERNALLVDTPVCLLLLAKSLGYVPWSWWWVLGVSVAYGLAFDNVVSFGRLWFGRGTDTARPVHPLARE